MTNEEERIFHCYVLNTSLSPLFQACTGIEDLEMAICQLEAAEWVLVDAVNKAMSATAAAPAQAGGPTAAADAAATGAAPTPAEPVQPPSSVETAAGSDSGPTR